MSVPHEHNVKFWTMFDRGASVAQLASEFKVHSTVIREWLGLPQIADGEDSAEPIQPHQWRMFQNLPRCARCGIVRDKTNVDAECYGIVRLGLRDE